MAAAAYDRTIERRTEKTGNTLKECFPDYSDSSIIKPDINTMKITRISAISIALLAISSAFSGCCNSSDNQTATEVSVSETVIENIMTRRSIRKYRPQPVGRDTMQIILNCGINAPNGQNKQSWEVRVVDNPEYINGITAAYLKENPAAGEDPSFVNMFRNAPTVVFIANDHSYDFSQIDCGLLAENMILSAWSMGIGSCCLGGPARFMTGSPAAADYVKQLGFSEGYDLLLCIAFGYPDETPAAKPRDASKARYID